MHWDFRVVRYTVKGANKLTLRRVQYKDAAREIVQHIDDYGPMIAGATCKEMLESVEGMLDAFDKPLLYYPSWNVE